MNSNPNPSDDEFRPPAQRPPEQQPPGSQSQPQQYRQEQLRLREEEERVAAAHRNAQLGKAVQVVYYLIGALAVLLTLRVLLRLLGANPENAIAQFIYGLSDPFIMPFYTLFGNPELPSGSVFEVTVVIAIAVYCLLGWLAARLIMLFSE